MPQKKTKSKRSFIKGPEIPKQKKESVPRLKKIPKKLVLGSGGSKNFRQAAATQLMTFNQPTYSDKELEYFEEAWATTPAGTALDKKLEIAWGKGWKPRFELIDPTNNDGVEFTEEEKQDVLSEYENIIKELVEFDELVHAKERFIDCGTMAKVFGRCVAAFETETEEKDKILPKALKIIHSRNLNKVNFDQATWDLLDVKTMNPSAILGADDMVYMVNRPHSPIRQTLWFGYSEMQRIAGAARAYRRIIEFDMPEIAHTMWAGYGMFLLKKLGRSQASQTTDANDIMGSLDAGSFNVVTVDAMDEIEFKQLDLDPKIKELVDLGNFYERIMIGNSQTPSALLGREEDQNRATLIGKIRFFKEGPVKAEQEWLSDILSEQWYEKNIKKMGHEKILEHVRVVVEYESFQVEAWDDMVDSAETLRRVMPGVPTETLITILNLEEHKDVIIEAQKSIDDEVKELAPETIKATKENSGGFANANVGGKDSFEFKEAKTLSWRLAFTNMPPVGDPIEQEREKEFSESSTVVGNVTYFPDDSTMTAQLSGRTYNYCNVPERTYQAWKGAASKGKFYNEQIKANYDCA